MTQAATAAPQGANHVMRGAVCALLGGAAWGFSGTCAQLLLNNFGIPSLWVTCVRLAIAAVVFMLLAVALDGRTLRACLRDVRSLVQIALFAVFGVVFTQMSYLLAIANTNAGTATVIQQVGLVIIMVVTCVRFRRGPKAREVAGLLFALAGVLVIATQGDLTALSISPEGLFWGLMCGVGLACYTLLPEQVLKKWGSLSVTGLAMLFGGFVAAAVVRPWTYDLALGPAALVALAALVVIGTFLAYLLYLQGVKDAGPVRASLLCCIEPVSAMVISAVWLGTPVSVWDGVGCVLILVMIFLVTGSPAEAERSAGDRAEPCAVGEGEASASTAAGSPALHGQDDPIFRGRASVLGYYASRPATREDFDAVSSLLKRTRVGLVAQRLVDEGKKYPSSRRLMRSIAEGLMHVVEDADGRLIAAFAVTTGLDKNYEHGIDGAWLSERAASGGRRAARGGGGRFRLARGGSSDPAPAPYAVLRWTCVEPDARRRGVGMFMVDKALSIARAAGCASLRCDIHPRNAAMRGLLDKQDFAYCGIIEVRDALGRVKRRAAFERLV